MGYQTVRALTPIRHSGVLRIPGQTSGDNAQDFVAEDTQANRLVALGYATSLGVASAPITPGMTSLGSCGYNVLADIIAQAERATLRNPRTAVPLTLAAANAAPTTGQVGYTNAGVNTSGYIETQFAAGYTLDAEYRADAARRFQVLGAINFIPLNRAGVNAIFRSNGNFQTGVSIPCVNMFRITTDEDQPIITFAVLDVNQTVQIRVDETMLTAEVVLPATAGAHNVLLDLSQLPSTGRAKTIDIMMDAHTNIGIKSVRVRGGKTVYNYPGRQPRICLITDSLGSTAPQNAKAGNSFGRCLADHMGLPSLVNIPAGGQGWVRGIGVPYLLDHLLGTRGEKFDAFFIFHGLNDFEGNNADFSGAQKTVQQGVAEGIQRLQQYAPGAPVVIGGAWPGNNTINSLQDVNYTQAVNKETMIKAAVDAAASPNVKFLPVMTGPDPWFTGYGNVENPTGTGNIEAYFIAADTLHWVSSAHNKIAQRAAYAITDVLRTITL